MIAIPRPAATILLLRDDPFEVLMVRRSAKGSFASALVFPGGTVDADDADDAWLPLVTGAELLSTEERALRIAAIRETFEEVGLFLGVDADGMSIAPASCDATDFRALVAASGARLPLDRLTPYAHWITPEIEPRRWDTHFFLCAAPAGQTPRCDDVETMAPEWLAPATALALGAAGERQIVFPTRLNLGLLARSDSIAAATAAAAARPIVTVCPVIERRGDERVALIPIEAGYGEAEFRHF